MYIYENIRGQTEGVRIGKALTQFINTNKKF
jgi:hypothetical protein